MSLAPAFEGDDDTRLERGLRLVLWIALAVSWVVAVAYLWEALATVRSAERLDESSLMGTPTLRTFVAVAIFSGLELGVVLAALWPWRPAFYASRLALTALGIVTWFTMTTPMDLSRMDWVHRRWLAFLALTVTAGLVTLLAYRLWRRLTDGRPRVAGPGAAE